jgi:hypothetical protein
LYLCFRNGLLRHKQKPRCGVTAGLSRQEPWKAQPSSFNQIGFGV